MKDIHLATAVIIERQRIQLRRDDTGHTEWQTLPSLWEELETSAAYSGTGAGGGPAQGPASISVVSLILEITATLTEAVVDHAGKSTGNVPDNLRRLASILTGNPTLHDELDWWTDKITEWGGDARAALRLNPTRPTWARGIHCPTCDADHAHTQHDRETVITPALAITWGGPDDDHYHDDRDWLVRAVECRSCGDVWPRGSALDDLVTAMLSTTHRQADIA